MKKRVITILLGLLSVIFTFGFTACGNGNENETEKEVRTTVTEEEWRMALMSKEMEKFEDKSFFNVKITTYFHDPYFDDKENEASELTAVYIIDYINKTFYVYNTGERPEELYAWLSGGVVYYWQNGRTGASNEFDDFFVDGSGAEYYLNHSAGFQHYYLDICDAFDKFTYDEDKKEYVGSTVNASSGGETNNYYFAFADGKLVRSGLQFVYNGLEGRTWKEEYVYGCTVTIPDEILNLDYELDK